MAIILTQNLVTVTGAVVPVVPLNHARIGYQTWTRGVTPSVTGTAPGFFAGALSNSLTYEYWKPAHATTSTIQYDFGEAKYTDYVGIGAHTLGDNATTVKIQYSQTGVGFGTVAEFTAEDNNAIMALFDGVLARYIRIVLTYTVAPKIAVIYAGGVLAMQRGMYGGHSPITLSNTTDVYSQVSPTGQWLGRSIVGKGFKSSAAWKNLTSDWYREYFNPFVLSARQYPYFFAWNPLQFDDEVALCWSNNNIQPSNSGIRNLMDVSIDLNGHGATI